MWNVMYNVIISIVTISMLFSSIFADDAPICILFASPMCDGWRLTEEAMSVMVCPAQASLVHHFLCWHFLSSIITCNYVILCRIAWTFDIYIYICMYTHCDMDPEFIPVHQVVAASVRSFLVPLVPGLGSAFYFASLLGVPEAMDHLIGHCQSTRPGKQW